MELGQLLHVHLYEQVHSYHKTVKYFLQEVKDKSYDNNPSNEYSA